MKGVILVANNNLADKERNKKLNEAFLYDIGCQHSKNICDETDELLEKYKDIEVPKSLDDWFDDFNKKEKARQKKHRIISKLKKISTRASVFIVALLIIGGSLTMGVEAFRIKFFNFIINETDTHTDLIPIESDKGTVNSSLPDDWSNYYFPTYLPEGYFLETFNKTENHERYFFSNGGETLVIMIQDVDNDSSLMSQLDSEGHELEFTEINGNNAVYLTKNDKTTISWIQNNMLIKITGRITTDEIILVAENIDYFK